MSESIAFTTYYEIPLQECSVLVLKKHFFELNSLKFYSFVPVLPSVVKLISYNPFFPHMEVLLLLEESYQISLHHLIPDPSTVSLDLQILTHSLLEKPHLLNVSKWWKVRQCYCSIYLDFYPGILWVNRFNIHNFDYFRGNSSNFL